MRTNRKFSSRSLARAIGLGLIVVLALAASMMAYCGEGSLDQ